MVASVSHDYVDNLPDIALDDWYRVHGKFLATIHTR